jgi:hypothetical protein
VRLALEQGLTTIALTDHDTVGGLEEAQRAARETALSVIPGVEINAEGEWGDLHVLGYHIDVGHGALQEVLRSIRQARLERARRMAERLDTMGMPVEWGAIRDLAHGESIGRPHIARALRNSGYVTTIQEAFDRFIGRDGPAYVPRKRLTPQETIELILAAGGVPVLAHPVHSGPAAVRQIPQLAEYGLRGLEVYYPSHEPREIEVLLAMGRKYDLIATGGSDFHAPYADGTVSLGSVSVPSSCVCALAQQVKRIMGSD